ncbi:sugar phosphate isomerase/epimerase family protein [Ohtaekwangia sp.]|uniref:sugar phosphate isomerase/epimerase family protein n=1 Tax=Ohtaekwangia sp. TaxID=2066019 RepID=UPI002F95CF40
MKRREFVQTASFAAAGLLSLPTFLAAGKVNAATLGLQLYSLRDSIPNDPKGVLQKVASFGYKELETYSYKDSKIFGMDFMEFGKYVKSLGMKVTSGHYGWDIVRGNWEQAVKDAKAIGQSYMVVPWIAQEERGSIASFKKLCGELNKAGEICNKHGIRLGYHNHAFEFDKVDGQVPYDVMLAELDPKKVSMEMDIFWVVNAGYDPIKYFEKYPGRFEQWHVKDMNKEDRNKNADVGTGSIDWKPIFAKAKQSGLKHYYVEQESYPGAPIDSVAACAKYLKTIL